MPFSPGRFSITVTAKNYALLLPLILSIFSIASGCTVAPTINIAAKGAIGSEPEFNQTPLAALRTAKRIALVIGNAQYGNWPLLNAPLADAISMAESLRLRDFQLIGDRSGSGAQLNVNATRFAALLLDTEHAVQENPGAVVVIYYAGHGMAFEGHNYLIPVDAATDVDPGATAGSSFSVRQIAARMTSAGSGVTAMFLDACRYYRHGMGGGLADEAMPPRSFASFAAQFGTTALGDSIHGYYTAALLTELDGGFDRFEDLHLAVSAVVAHRSQGQQVPVYREGAGMPSVPIRLSVSDPQTAFSVAQSQLPAPVILAAKRCAAQADLRLLMAAHIPDLQPQHGLFQWGPIYEPVDISALSQACHVAYAGGNRDPKLLRSLALLDWVEYRNGLSPLDKLSIGQRIAMTAQAADDGDPVANLLLGMQEGNHADGDLTPYEEQDRLLVAADGSDPMVTWFVSWLLQRRADADPSDKKYHELSQRYFRKAVLAGNPIALGSAYMKAYENDPSVAGLPLTAAMELAMTKGSDFGIYISGTSIRETLYLLAIMSALRDKKWPAAAYFTLPAADFLGATLHKFLAGNHNASSDVDQSEGAVLELLGCLLYTGRDPYGDKLEGFLPNRIAAITLFRQAAEYRGKLQTHALQTSHRDGGGCPAFVKR